MKSRTYKLTNNSIIFGALTFILATLSYNYLDVKIVNIIYMSDFFSVNIISFTTIFSKAFSPKTWAMITFLITILCIYNFFIKKPSDALCTMSLALIVTFFIVGIMKFSLARSRPELLIFNNIYTFHFFSPKESFNSMPSGHTTLSFTGLLAIANFFKKKHIKALTIFIACIVAVSRIIILNHFISDVIISTYIGIFCYLWVKCFIEADLHKMTE